MFNDLINDQESNKPEPIDITKYFTPKMKYNDITRGPIFKHILRHIMNQYDIEPERIENHTGIDSTKIKKMLNKTEDMDEIDLMSDLFQYLSVHTNWQSCTKSLVSIRQLIVELSEIHTKFLLDRLYNTVERIGTDE